MPERSCRGDAFFVEVRLRERTPWPDRSFAERARTALQTLARQEDARWFENPPSDPETVTVEIDWVLEPWPVDPVPAFRRGGEDRFFRFRFTADSKRLTVRKEFQCEVVAAIRNEVYQAVGGNPENVGLDRRAIAVGRECDALPLSVPTAYSTVKSWHTEALLAEDLNNPGLPNVDLAVIDSPIIPPTVDRPGLTHGTAMHRLIRQIGPAANILDYEAIDPAGFATSQSIARAIDDAVRHAYEWKRTTVLNLSLDGRPTNR
jgi:hypothetical protein